MHILVQAWDMAAEMCLMQLPTLLSDPERAQFQPSPFFSEQLTAFELWLSAGGRDKKPPEQLPIVLQVCAALTTLHAVVYNAYICGAGH
jgi:regulator-associated protein of mTOR